MNAMPPDEEILRKEIYRLRKSLRKDIAEVEGASRASSLIPRDAIKHMKKIEKSMRKTPVKYMKLNDLRSTFRQLKYIRDLKSSTVQGAAEIGLTFEPIRKNINKLSEDEREEWWGIYGKLYKEFTGYERFKYDIFNVVDKKFGDIQDKNILEVIKSVYRNTIELTSLKGLEDEELKDIISKNILELSKENEENKKDVFNSYSEGNLDETIRLFVSENLSKFL